MVIIAVFPGTILKFPCCNKPTLPRMLSTTVTQWFKEAVIYQIVSHFKGLILTRADSSVSMTVTRVLLPCHYGFFHHTLDFRCC